MTARVGRETFAAHMTSVFGMGAAISRGKRSEEVARLLNLWNGCAPVGKIDHMLGHFSKIQMIQHDWCKSEQT